jgi:hypothetical protein
MPRSCPLMILVCIHTHQHNHNNFTKLLSVGCGLFNNSVSILTVEYRMVAWLN